MKVGDPPWSSSQRIVVAKKIDSPPSLYILHRAVEGRYQAACSPTSMRCTAPPSCGTASTTCLGRAVQAGRLLNPAATSLCRAGRGTCLGSPVCTQAYPRPTWICEAITHRGLPCARALMPCWCLCGAVDELPKPAHQIPASSRACSHVCYPQALGSWHMLPAVATTLSVSGDPSRRAGGAKLAR